MEFYPHQTSLILASCLSAPKNWQQKSTTGFRSKNLQEKISIKASSYFVKVWQEMWEKSIITKPVTPGLSAWPSVIIGPSRIDMLTRFTTSSKNSRIFSGLLMLSLHLERSQMM